MKKLFFNISLMGVAFASTFVACKKNTDINIKTERQQLSSTVEQQLNLSRENWNQYAGSLAKFRSFESVKTISTDEEKKAVLQQVLSPDSYLAYGNVLDLSSLSLQTVNSLGHQSAASIDTLSKYAASLIQKGDVIVDIQWEKGNLHFISKCIVRNDSIVWDNLLTNVIMMDPEGKTMRDSSVDNPAAKYYRQWYKEWRTWTVNWIWGSRRGDMGEEITVWPYSDGRVYNTDARSWAFINIGSYRSESKVLVNSGTYGKIQYAVGVATPAASVTFNSSSFKVEVHGIGSSRVENGTHSLTPFPL